MQTARTTLLLGLLCFAASGQQDATFSAGVDVVNVLATVRDKNGALVTDLAKDDFVLKEDGAKQEIQYFARQTDLPLTIGLLVDTSISQIRVLEQQRTASYRFLERVLQEQDQAFVIRFDFDVELLQDLTNSKRLLKSALAKLEAPDMPRLRRRFAPKMQFPGGSPFPGGRRRDRLPRDRVPSGGGPPQRGAGTTLYDAVYLAANEMLMDQGGRKALIVVSDGVDMGSRMDEEQATEAVHRQDGILYSVYFADERRFGGSIGPMPDGEKILDEMSGKTGGRLYKLSGDTTLEEIFDGIEEELRSQYSLGYTPSAGAAPGFREIELEAKGGLTVSTRAGYYPSAQ